MCELVWIVFRIKYMNLLDVVPDLYLITPLCPSKNECDLRKLILVVPSGPAQTLVSFPTSYALVNMKAQSCPQPYTCSFELSVYACFYGVYHKPNIYATIYLFSTDTPDPYIRRTQACSTCSVTLKRVRQCL